MTKAEKPEDRVEHIRNPLSSLLESDVFAQGLAGWRAVELWPDVVGESIQRRSRAVRYDDGTLLVEVASSAWLCELAGLERRIRRRINQKLGREAVQRIRLVLAGGGRPHGKG